MAYVVYRGEVVCFATGAILIGEFGLGRNLPIMKEAVYSSMVVVVLSVGIGECRSHRTLVGYLRTVQTEKRWADSHESFERMASRPGDGICSKVKQFARTGLGR